jgi:hypothetical protein
MPVRKVVTHLKKLAKTHVKHLRVAMRKIRYVTKRIVFRKYIIIKKYTTKIIMLKNMIKKSPKNKKVIKIMKKMIKKTKLVKKAVKKAKKVMKMKVKKVKKVSKKAVLFVVKMSKKVAKKAKHVVRKIVKHTKAKKAAIKHKIIRVTTRIVRVMKLMKKNPSPKLVIKLRKYKTVIVKSKAHVKAFVKKIRRVIRVTKKARVHTMKMKLTCKKVAG